MTPYLEEKLGALPDQPGVYLMRDASGELLYVGKATSLRQRVRSYFRSPEQQGAKTRALVQHIADLEYIVTSSPVEALVLENNLIKQHHPRYNIDLRDDKTYPYLRVTLADAYPRLTVTRARLRDGSRYFGPYTQVGALRETLKLLRRLFPVRSCSDATLQRGRACLNAHIKRCAAPCAGRISREEYGRVVENLLLFLEGKGGDVAGRLRREMEEAAARLDFEAAARLRDQWQAVEEVLAHQQVVTNGTADRDVLALAREQGLACGQVFFVRGGLVVDREHYFLTGAAEEERERVMSAFVQQYYNQVDDIPPEILLSEDAAEWELLEEWLGKKRGRRVRLQVPRRGEKARLVELAHKNALLVLRDHMERVSRPEEEDPGAALRELAMRLDLREPPRRIEGYDISNLQGTNSVGSLVVFLEGRPCPAQYRRFQIRSVAGPNDFASLQEVLSRRLSYLLSQTSPGTEDTGQREEGFGVRPDLVLIDGGKGQVAAVAEIFQQLGLVDVPLLGLAKREEQVFRPGVPQPLPWPQDCRALQLLKMVRDEAHRFALSYHHRLRQRQVSQSILDEVPGIGPRRKKALLRQFGSLKNLRRASVEELVAVEGMTRTAAEVLAAYLARTPSPRPPGQA